MGQMIEDVRLHTGCKRPVGLCNRVGGMIPSPDQVLESIRNAEKGVYLSCQLYLKNARR